MSLGYFQEENKKRNYHFFSPLWQIHLLRWEPCVFALQWQWSNTKSKSCGLIRFSKQHVICIQIWHIWIELHWLCMAGERHGGIWISTHCKPQNPQMVFMWWGCVKILTVVGASLCLTSEVQIFTDHSTNIQISSKSYLFSYPNWNTTLETLLFFKHIYNIFSIKK